MQETATARLAYQLPSAPVPSRYGYVFKGWYAGKNSTGTRYYDENCSALVPLWTRTDDLTLYPGWEENPYEPLDEVMLTINGIDIHEGTDASGAGWTYSAEQGRIDIFENAYTNEYDISGKDMHGFAQIFVSARGSTIKVTQTLAMQPGGRGGYTPITVMSGSSTTVEVSRVSRDDAACSLMGADGRTAISVQPGATLTLKTGGWLEATGGADAADLGLNSGESSCGDIYVETYNNWFARVRPGHGLSSFNGLVNNLGKSAKFISTATNKEVWSVRMTGLADGPIYRQRIDGDEHDYVEPDYSGSAWFWLPNDGWEWGNKMNASLSHEGDIIWICYVDGKHSIADVFYPLHVEINGEDIAHLTGDGWYAELHGTSGGVVEGTRAALVITNAGPHVITGYGNAGIDVLCDAGLTISNLTLNTASWGGKCAIWLKDGVTLDMSVEGESSLVSGANCPGIAVYSGRTLNIGGSGSLVARGGSNAAGIGGNGGNMAGNINIAGGLISATGGENAAGIGGGDGQWGGDIGVSGGIVTAHGGQGGAGIGGGRKGKANVSITGGTVYPAGNGANAVGNGSKAADTAGVKNTFGWAAIYNTACEKVLPRAVNESGNAVFPVTFDVGMANCQVTDIAIDKVGIPCRDIWTDEDGDLVLWLESTKWQQHSITVAVTDGTTVAKKSWGYRVDDNGRYEFSRDVVTVDGEPIISGIGSGGTGWDYDGTTGILAIRSGTHEVSGNSTNGSIRIVSNGPGVGITLNKLTLKTPESDLSPFVVSNSCTLTLVDKNTVECIHNPDANVASRYGSRYTAAIEVPEGSSLTINGGGTLTANGGIWGAGIGSRGQNLNAGSIRIDGGYIYAQGGSHNKQLGGGAGIGGGDGGGVASILVTGGYVDAKGGNGACGIGGGAGRGVTLTNGTFRVTGGTVLAAKGSDDTFSDFVTGIGNTGDPTMGGAIVIDGPCSVRPKNTVVANANPYPNPVNSSGARLVFAMIGGLGPGDEVMLLDDLWPQYAGSSVVADDGGAVCLWGEYTNAVHSIHIESANTPGGGMTFDISAASNTIYNVSDDYEAPGSRQVGGETCWRVEVKSLPAGKRLPVTGIDPPFSRGTTVSDSTGMTYLYLPDGEYDFTVGGYSYHASVNGAPAAATFKVGILVDGVDIGEGSGRGWSYSGTTETLSLNNAAEYLIGGTNAERRVSVCVEKPGAKIRADRLVLKDADNGAFYSADGALFEYVGGTVATGRILSRMVVSGGSIEGDVVNPVASTAAGYTNAYKVVVGGLPRYAHVGISGIDGIGGYDTEGLYANKFGEVYLYLPNGDYLLRATDGVATNELIAVVEDGEATAVGFTPTGVYINGRDAAWLRGRDDAGATIWRNDDGLVRLMAATDYVIAGTNDGPAVTFKADVNRTRLVLDSLVLANARMEASPISVGSGRKSTFTVELRGTNVLHAAASGSCGVELQELAELNFTGDGRLEVQGAGPGIGMGRGQAPDQSSIVVNSGDVVATGGDGAAGIGGGGGQGGIGTYIYGGKVTATGGENAAGIGGGSGGNAGRYRQSGGTVVARGGGAGKDIGSGGGGSAGSAFTTVLGGSLNSSTGKMSPEAKGGAGTQVYCVTVPTGRPNFDIGAVMGDFNGYSLAGAVTDDEGKVYIWLPDGEHHINIGRTPFIAVVDGADTVAEEWHVGVEVNGDDVALQSGDGWTYDFGSKVLSVSGDGCTVSGSNTTGAAFIQFTNDVSVVFSNLVLAATSSESASPVSVLNNATVNIFLAGSNSLTSAALGYAGLNVPHGSTLAITNIDSIVSIPDLDGIYVYTNTLYDIEYDEEGNPKIDPDTGCVITNGVVYDVHAVTNYHDAAVPPTLEAVGGESAAGIGGNKFESHGLIKVFGGALTASGNKGAGIGSGYFPDSGDGFADAGTLRQGEIRIFGGSVTAVGGSLGAGIGGGNRHSGGVIAISGGSVAASSAGSGSGIGGGWGARGHTIEISGGEVTATGGSLGAGIGGGHHSSVSVANTEPCRVLMSGGRVNATGGTAASGIGAGYLDNQCAVVNISGGTVVAKGGSAYSSSYSTPDDIGGGSYSESAKAACPLTVGGASVHALRRTPSSECVSPAPSNGAERVYCVTVETAKTNELVEVSYLDGFDEGSDIYADENGRIYLWLPNGTYVFYVDEEPRTVTVDGTDAMAAMWLTGVTIDGVDAARRMGDGQAWYYDFVQRQLIVIEDCMVAGTNTEGFVNILACPLDGGDGGAEPSISLTISNLCLKSSSAASPFTVSNGTVTVCLAGTNTLDAASVPSAPGLLVSQASTLVVTSLQNDAKLVARGGSKGAGIGGGTLDAGDITINGGIVDATGGEYAAGIGGGFQRKFGTICITGGEVTAESPGAGAGIGSGQLSSGGVIEISGGVVSATAHTTGAGIGSGGFYNTSTPGTAGTITISGGEVTARSVSNYSGIGGAGIGGGAYCRGGNITISGGRVKSSGGERGAGIGGGTTQHAESVIITGGTVVPTGGADAKAIGHGYNPSGSVGSIVIDGGSVATMAESIVPAATNSQHAAVYRVELGGFTPGGKVELEMQGYGSNDIYAGADGRIYLWLADGTCYCRANGQRYAMKIEGGVATTVPMPDAYGVLVDGVDVVNISGDAWSYDPFTDTLSITNDCMVAGTNSAAAVKFDIDTDVTLSPARLSVGAGSIGADLLTGSGTVTMTNGTAHLVGALNNPVVVLGGSIKHDGSAAVAFSNEAERVYRVMVDGLKPMSPIVLDGLPAYYGTSGIFADDDERIYLWLPNGDYVFSATDEDSAETLWKAHVADANTTAEEFVPAGFTVNGCDVAFLGGEGWSYSDGAVDGGITLSGAGPYELTGSLTNKYLMINNSCSIVFSNAVFNAFNIDTQHGVVRIGGGYDVNLTIKGTNSVTAPTGAYLAGIRVPEGASLTIDGNGSLGSIASPYAAGIGGGRNAGCGTITINGGVVTATGGSYAAGIGGGGCTGDNTSNAGTIRINGGVVTAAGGSYAAGIGGGGNANGGFVEITGGRVSATSGSGGGACIGAGFNGTYGDVSISGGTVVASTDEFRTRAIGDGYGTDGFGKVTISGGSLDADPAGITPAPSNGTVAVYCVAVSNLAANTKVAFDGLPEGYGTRDIYSDAAGSVYLWLPESWPTPSPLLSASPRGRLGAPAGTERTFFANGYKYTVTIDSSAVGTVAEQGDPLPLESLRIDDFAVEDGHFAIRFTAKPATWLYSFADLISIRFSETLPIPDAADALLDLSNAELQLEGVDAAIIVVPFDGAASNRFFKVEGRSP
ncbi:MAG: hypothetical protein J6T51_01830 [Kiritimatiellae bacterium]|nr:hypothetical protein [Kiritimatiellia bacterium]